MEEHIRSRFTSLRYEDGKHDIHLTGWHAVARELKLARWVEATYPRRGKLNGRSS